MTNFSANLGFLWKELPLPDAIRAAKEAGFDAVECHWPYDTPADLVKAALQETNLRMLGLNTRRGDVAAGENGLSALPKRGQDARAAIDEAVAYADAIDAAAVHVMAGFASGDAAKAQFIENLRYATNQTDRMILIEPLNRHDAPGYFLQTTTQAREIIELVDEGNLKLMFDCYHIGRTEGDIITRLADLFPIIGHIQFASVPTRSTPDQGGVCFSAVFAAIRSLGWDVPLGAEYVPDGPTSQSLAWMKDARIK